MKLKYTIIRHWFRCKKINLFQKKSRHLVLCYKCNFCKKILLTWVLFLLKLKDSNLLKFCIVIFVIHFVPKFSLKLHAMKLSIKLKKIIFSFLNCNLAQMWCLLPSSSHHSHPSLDNSVINLIKILFSFVVSAAWEKLIRGKKQAWKRETSSLRD